MLHILRRQERLIFGCGFAALCSCSGSHGYSPSGEEFRLAFTATGLVLAVALTYFSFSGVFFALLVVGMAVVHTLPYLIDRVLAHRLKGMPGTLVFPLATAHQKDDAPDSGDR